MKEGKYREKERGNQERGGGGQFGLKDNIGREMWCLGGGDEIIQFFNTIKKNIYPEF